MGTRHLIAVQVGGEYKIAQYGQWDGYPSGQGLDVLKFLNTYSRDAFIEKVRAASFATKEDFEAIDQRVKDEGIKDWAEVWPHLSRDAGAKILQMVNDAPAGIKLRNSIGFAGDSLFCEWAYVIDFDANVLEVYRGFNKSPLAKDERFAKIPDLEKNAEYTPIRRAARYSLDALPTVDQIEKDCANKEEVEA